ncbi:MAG TPA: alpha/beta fold hydrolase [Solirubrobacteraceae bacterium]|nr:alpha/beta fold hydrolase [Solirubrobacteraceae bacterium]
MSVVAQVVRSALASPARRLRYGRDHRDQRAELWLPPGPGPHPVCVVLHGGWWQARRTRTKLYTRPLSRDLTRHGWAACNVEYRRLGAGGGWPMTFDDVAAAIDRLAGEPGLDLRRVVLLGHSAGGHLALWAGNRPGARVRAAAVVALAAPSDLEATRDAAAIELMGGPPERVPRNYMLGNPIRRLPLGIPVLLVHGTLDAVVPVRRSRDYAAAARAAGDDVTLVEFPGGHRDPVDPRAEPWPAVIRWLSRW